MAKERTCMICGRHYKFCHHCKEYEQEPKWKYLYHDEKCKQIGDIWFAFRGNEISKEDARKALSKLTPNIDVALKYTGTIASNEIRAIFDVDVAPKDDIVEEKEVVESNKADVAEKEPEAVQQQPKRRNSKKQNRETE